MHVCKHNTLIVTCMLLARVYTQPHEIMSQLTVSVTLSKTRLRLKSSNQVAVPLPVSPRPRSELWHRHHWLTGIVASLPSVWLDSVTSSSFMASLTQPQVSVALTDQDQMNILKVMAIKKIKCPKMRATVTNCCTLYTIHFVEIDYTKMTSSFTEWRAPISRPVIWVGGGAFSILWLCHKKIANQHFLRCSTGKLVGYMRD